MTPETFEKICEEIETTSKGLNKICSELGFGRESFYILLRASKELQDRYARARETQVQVLADEIVEIADTPQVGTISTSKEWGEEVKTADMLDHRKLQIESRKWLLAKLAPKKYGDKLDLTTDGDKINAAAQPLIFNIVDSRKKESEDAVS